MRIAVAVFLLAGLLGSTSGDDARGTVPAGITCCDEQKIRLAMTEEALARIVSISRSDRKHPADYLSVQAHEKIRRLLPTGDAARLLAFLRELLGRAAQEGAEADLKEFHSLISNFVLGMTLEIGITFQDECDQAQASGERAGRLLAALEKNSPAEGPSLSRNLFLADVSEKELRRLRSLEGRWKEVPAGASPFEEFNILKRNATGGAADPDQGMVFDLAERYRAAHPFLDEFLATYRRLAAEIRETARRINERLAGLEE